MCVDTFLGSVNSYVRFLRSYIHNKSFLYGRFISIVVFERKLYGNLVRMYGIVVVFICASKFMSIYIHDWELLTHMKMIKHTFS